MVERTAMKMCKDCKHYVPNSFARYAMCNRVINPGDGQPTTFCNIERNPDYDSANPILNARRCGYAGKFFEPAPPKKPGFFKRLFSYHPTKETSNG